TERERRAAARALGERVERGLERRQGVDDQLVRRLLAKALVGDELLDGVGFDRRDRLVDQRFGLVAVALSLGHGEADAVVVDQEGVRTDADRTGVAFDDVPDRGEVHARADRGEDDPIGDDRRREEEGGLVCDDRVGGIAYIGRALHGGEEILAEGDTRPLIGLDRCGGDRRLRVDDRGGFVFRRQGRGGAGRGTGGAAG